MAKSAEIVGDTVIELMTDSCMEGFNLQQKGDETLTTILQYQMEHLYGDGPLNTTDEQGQTPQIEQKSQEILTPSAEEYKRKNTEEDGTKVTIEDLVPVLDNHQQDDDTISLSDDTTETSYDVPVTMGTMVPCIGLPDKQPSEEPSTEASRPQYRPAFIKVNGKWVSLNKVKRPCVLVRVGYRISRVWRRFSRWYDKEVLDFIIGHARRQADKRRDEGFRQQQQQQQQQQEL